MRSTLVPLSLCALAACHPAPRVVTVAAPPAVAFHVRLAEGSARGKLVTAWLDAEAAARWRKGHVTATDFVTVLGRIQIEDGVTLSTTPRPLSLRAPAGAAAIAVLDPGGEFWLALMGARGLFGLADGTEVVLRARPPRTPPPCEGPRMQAIVIDAPEVVGSAGNERARRFCAALPKSYATTPARRYPVVYLLPGFHSSDVAYLRGYGREGSFAAVADRVAEETGRELILVGVDTSTAVGSTYLVDSPVNGAFDRFMAGRAIDTIDATLRTVATREGRALIGHSTGGFNAISFGLRHPERFAALGASSPDALDLDVWMLDGQRRVGGWVLDWLRAEAAIGGLGQMLSYAADWSPKPGGGWELPCDPRTGVTTPAYDRWKASSPSRLIDAPPLRDTLVARFTDRIYLGVGVNDEFGLTPPTRAFAKRLEERGVKPTFEIEGQGHFDGMPTRFEHALRFVAQRVAAAR